MQNLRLSLITILLLYLLPSFHAQSKMSIISKGNILTYEMNDNDSLYFDDSKVYIFLSSTGTTYEYKTAEIDSLLFIQDEQKNVFITYDQSNVQIINPLVADGVSVTPVAGYVTVNSISSQKDINYIISGASNKGDIKIYSDKRFNLLLNNVSLKNPIGPAINIQSNKNSTINLLNFTDNSIQDSTLYNDAPVTGGVPEDQKATLFGEGDLTFLGPGRLNIKSWGIDQHAIRSDDKISIEEGNISISSSANDGIHSSDGFTMNGGNLNITSTADGIDGDKAFITINCGNINFSKSNNDQDLITTDSTITINGGNFNMTVSGNQSKGLKSGMDMNINGGNFQALASGAVVLETNGSGYNPSYTTIFDSDSNINIYGGKFNLYTTGEATRGFSSNGDLNLYPDSLIINSIGNGKKYLQSDGTYDAYHGSCIRTDGNLRILGGYISLANSGSGGKAISCDSDITIGENANYIPEINLKTTGTKITITSGSGGMGSNGTYDESKTMKADGAISIKGGNINIESADDGIKAEGNIILDGGKINIKNSIEGIEAPFITINDCEVDINSSDDSFNATHGNGGESNDNSLLTINGGKTYLSSTAGDPLDSNGSIKITGGNTIVHGPSSSPEVGMDFNGTSIVTGGMVIIAAPNGNMTQSFNTSSTQNSILGKTSTSITANTIIHLEDNNGNSIFTFQPIRKYGSIIFSSVELKTGEIYKLYTGGTCTGTEVHGLYSGGTYSGGTLKKTFTVSNKVTNFSF